MGSAETPEDISHPPATEEEERAKHEDGYGQDCSSQKRPRVAQLSTDRPAARHSPRASFLQAHERFQHRGARDGAPRSQGKTPSKEGKKNKKKKEIKLGAHFWEGRGARRAEQSAEARSPHAANTPRCKARARRNPGEFAKQTRPSSARWAALRGRSASREQSPRAGRAARSALLPRYEPLSSWAAARGDEKTTQVPKWSDHGRSPRPHERCLTAPAALRGQPTRGQAAAEERRL